MIQLTQRQTRIISHLNSNGKTKCNQLSIALRVSDKTIRNEIKAINASISETLIYSDYDGYYLERSKLHLLPITINFENSIIEGNDFYNILQHLLLANEPTNFDSIADYFCISTSALQTKIKAINEFALDYDIAVKRKNNHLFLEGTNYNKRRLLLKMIYSETDSSFSDINDYERFFPLIDTVNCKKIIIDAINEFNCHLPAFYETNLLINIYAILSLNKKGDYVVHKITVDTIENQIANRIVENLSIINKEYIQSMIASTLTGIVLENSEIGTKQKQIIISNKYRDKIEKIVQEAFNYYSISIDFSSFITIFSNHVFELVQRLKEDNTCVISSPISIRDTYVFIYDVAVYICKKIGDEFDVVIPESEISLIAIHIGFAIESTLHKNKRIKLALYTFNYPLIEAYILEKIKDQFIDNIEIMKINEVNEIQYITNIDLLITTQSMIPNGTYEYCKISPLLTNRDKVKIQKSIFEILDKQKKKEFCSLVSRCFDSELFFYDESLTNRKSVLQFLDLHLQLKGVVDNTFLTSVLKREELDPTCFMNVFAIPHAFESKALKSKIAVLINPKGIKWDKQVVSFVFLIALNHEDKASFQPLFDGFADILADDKKIMDLDKVKTIEDFISFIT